MAFGKKVGTGKETFEIEKLAELDSVMANHESPGVSSRYKFYSTFQVIKSLAEEGWLPVLASEQWSKNISGQGYQKHCVRFRHVNARMLTLNDVFPEIVLTNAHNGLARYSLFAALMRLACWNGLIVSQAVFGAIGFRHVGFELQDVIDASKQITEGLPLIESRITEYRQIALNNTERYNFATKALSLRFSAPAIEDRGLIKIENRSFSAGELLEPIREGDATPTLWNTFNIIQEKVTKGAKFERTAYLAEAIGPGGIPAQRIINRSKVKGIRAINTDISFNRSLWALMENERVRRAQALVPVNAF